MPSGQPFSSLLQSSTQTSLPEPTDWQLGAMLPLPGIVHSLSNVQSGVQ